MFNGYYGKLVRIINYGKSYRSLGERVEDGVVTIRHRSGDVVRAVISHDEITEVKVHRQGRLKYAVKYGEFEKQMKDGKVVSIKRYHKASSRGYHGLTVRNDVKVEGQEGRCHSFFSRGRLLWQKFTYANGRTAYYVRANDKVVQGVHPNGKQMFKITVSHLWFKGKEGFPFLYSEDYGRTKWNFSTDGMLCEYEFRDALGRVRERGKFENRQQVGETIRNYRQYFFLSGIEVPKKLYETDPKDLKAKQVLKVPNAQARAMLLKRIGIERVISECKGKVIDKDNGYELIDFPVSYDRKEHEADKTLRILKVICPSTKGNYFLRIPPTKDFATVRRARNGTFTGFDPEAKEVKFAIET